MNWQKLNELYLKRAKNSAVKRIFPDCGLYQRENGLFEIMYEPMVGWKKENRKRLEPVSLATMDKDNLLTITHVQKLTPTTMRRISALTDTHIYSDAKRHGNKEQCIRIYKGNPQWKTAADKTIPYASGLQFLMDAKYGTPEKLLNPPTDMKTLVKSEAIQQAKAETKVLRTLIHAMERIGVFDEYAVNRLNGKRNPQPPLVADINYKNPSAEDAIATVNLGLRMSDLPQYSDYVNGQWVKTTDEDRRKIMLARGINNGLRLVRTHIYDLIGGYEKVVA
jgi:hypothetical protein